MDIYPNNPPSYAGGATFARTPLIGVEDVAPEQVVFIGAPIDESVGTRPGARFGPRAIRQGDDGSGDPKFRRHLDLGVHPFVSLDVADSGDLPVVSGDPVQNLQLVEEAVMQVVERGGIPVILGGDHSLSGATIAGAVRAGKRKPHVVQFDAHADTARPGPGRPEWSHGSQFFNLIEMRHLIEGPDLSQLGLRGWWPDDDVIGWERENQIRWWTARDMRRRGVSTAVSEVLERSSKDSPLWLSIDIDVVDPAFAPGTGTPEPGGMTSGEILDAVLELASSRDIMGIDLVEVAPIYDPAGITGLLGNRIVLEALSGMAHRKDSSLAPTTMHDVR